VKISRTSKTNEL